MDEGRGLKQLAQLSVERRLEAIAEGLSLIAENVRSLRDDIACLYEGKRLRAAEVMTARTSSTTSSSPPPLTRPSVTPRLGGRRPAECCQVARVRATSGIGRVVFFW
jgi:hypothetical protein